MRAGWSQIGHRSGPKKASLHSWKEIPWHLSAERPSGRSAYNRVWRYHPLWPSGLSDLIPGLGVSASDLKNAADVYWASQPVEDAVLRVAFQQRQKGAHEAHDHPYYEHERHAFFIFAAMIVVAKVLLDTNAEAQKAVMCQQHMDSIRDLFVRIDELQIGPYGPRTSFRLDRLAAIAARAQAIWPNCSSLLYELMNSEYLCAKAEIIEDEREAEIDAYLEGMAEDRYS